MLERKFIVRTDQRSLKFLLEQRLVSMEHQKWLTKLWGYDFDIQYRPGLENKAADALPRRELVATLMVMTISHVIQLDELVGQVVEDANLKRIVVGLQKDPLFKPAIL